MHEIEYLMYWYLRSAPAELQHLVPAWATPVTTTSTHLYGNPLISWCVCVSGVWDWGCMYPRAYKCPLLRDDFAYL